jgi:hypothetical protein
MLHRDVHVAAEVRGQRGCARGVIEQHERCELGQLQPFVEDEVGLQPGIGDEHLTAQLW